MFHVLTYGSSVSQKAHSIRSDSDLKRRGGGDDSALRKRGPRIEKHEGLTSRVEEVLKRDLLAGSESSTAAARYKQSWSYADKKGDQEKKATRVALRTIPRGPALSPQQLTVMISQTSSFQGLMLVYEEHGNGFNHIHLVATLNTLANISESGRDFDFEGFVKELIGRIRPQVSKLDARNLATTVYSCAKLNIKDETLMRAIAVETPVKIEGFKSQGLSNIAWAYATLGVYDKALMDVIAGAAQVKIGGFVPQDLSNTAWAYATLDVYNEALMSAIAVEAPVKIRLFIPQELSNTAWAYAKLGVYNEALMSAIARAAQVKIRRFIPQNLSNTAWAYAALGVYNQDLMSAIARAVQVKIGGFNSQNLSNTAWAYAKLGVYNEALMRAIAVEAQVKIGGFDPQGLSNTAWAYATLGVYNQDLMSAIAREAQAKIGEFKPQELSNTAWAIAVFGIKDSPLLPLLKAEINSRLEKGVLFCKEDMRQLRQVSDWLRLTEIDSLFILEDKLSTFERSKDGKGKLEDAVEAAMRAVPSGMKWLYVKEAHIPVIHHDVDFLLCCKETGKVCVIEVDGPSHYSKSKTLLGATILRDRLIKAMGYDLVTIPYYEWDDLRTFEDQVVYLQRRLSAFLESDAASSSGSL